jgi:GH35 family endo-1,4-beta-xylanase
LPRSVNGNGCNLQAAYITWLDTPSSGNTDVQQLQKYVVNQLKRPYWVNTELYSTTQIQQYYSTYTPYQTIITGYWGANDSASWGQGMCGKWNTAAHPTRFGAWTFYDMDLTGSELYRAYINGGMANIGSICTY